MPRPTERRIERQQVLDPISKPEGVQITARPVDTTVAPVRDTTLSQVAAGLAALNPGLEKYVVQKNTNDAEFAFSEGQRLAEKAALDPNAATQVPESVPENVRPAFKDNFQNGFKTALGVRMADRLQADMLSEWNKVRLREDVDPEQFITDWTAKNTAGFNDAISLKAITARHVETVKAIRADARSVQFQRLVDSQKQNVNALFSDIRADQSNEDRITAFQRIVPEALKLGVYTRSELNSILLDRLNAISTAQGGAPEVFDVILEAKDPATGKSLAELNPQLAEKAIALKKAADAQVDQRLNQAMEPVHYEMYRKWEQRAAEGNPPTDEELKAEIGPRGMFRTMEQAMSARNRLYQAADAQRGLAQGVALARAGMLGAIAKREDQQKVMDAITAPYVGPLFASMNTPGAEAQADQLISGIINAHANSGGSVANSQLRHAFASLKQRAPGKDAAPDPQFTALANVYAKLPPNLKAVYAEDDDVRALLETYNSAIENRTDAKSAYQLAYRAVDPEARKVAEEFRKDPEKRAQVAKWVRGEFAKDGALPNLFRAQWMGTYPTNEGVVEQWAILKAEELIRQNPNLMGQPDVLKKQLQTSVAESWVYDTAADVLVETPRGQANAKTAEAMSLYSESLRSRYGKDAKPELRHMGSGTYQVWSTATNKYLETVRLSDIVGDFHARTALDPRTKEGERLNAIHKAALAGTLTAAMVAGEADLIAKARKLDILSPEVVKRIESTRESTFRDTLMEPLNDAPRVGLEGADYALKKSDGRAMTDTANHLWATGRYGMALTAMSEGVRLKAYKDNKGTAIGVGYNMDANAKNLHEDFRRSGIPVEKIEDIKAGKVQITEDQAIRLFAVAYQRHEKVAKDAVDRLYGPGSWDKLPVTKKAVLADVSYQAGTPEKFPQALDALVRDIGDLRAQNPRVHYRKDGAMVEDVRRNEMRLRMLGGLSSFGATIAHVARKPRSIIEARALEEQQKQ